MLMRMQWSRSFRAFLKESTLLCDELIIFNYTLGYPILETIFRRAICIGTMVLPESTLTGRTFASRHCRILSLDSDYKKIAVVNPIAVSPERANDWTHTLFENITPLK